MNIYIYGNQRFKKEIYKISKDKGIITQALYDELYRMYDERNKVVHRYIISEITTKDILEIAIQYSNLREQVYNIAEQFEKQQIELGLGISISEVQLDKETILMIHERLLTETKEKHGDIDFRI